MSREPAAAPIVDKPQLRPMAGSQPVLKRIGGKVLRMDEPATPPAGAVLMTALPARLQGAVSEALFAAPRKALAARR